MNKIKIFSLIVISIILLFSFTVFNQTTYDPSSVAVPEDFSFSITWDCYGISSYDSKTGTLVKTWDATHPEDYITTLQLTKDELKSVYIKLTRDIDLYSFTEKYNPFRMGYDSRPTQTIILSIEENGKSKTVICENIAFGDEKWMKNKKARNFMRVKNEIVDIITDTDEWKALPDYEFGYD